jgi:two-component system response regulator YesN
MPGSEAVYRLLIADDEKLERDSIEYVVRRSTLPIGEIRKAANGKEAAALAVEWRPDIAVLDIRMPGMDGIEAARAIRGAGLSCRILFLTAFTRFEYAREAVRLAADDFIVKPATDGQILQPLEKAIRTIEAEREAAFRNREREKRLQRVTRYVGSDVVSSLMAGEIEEHRIGEHLELLGIETCRGYAVAVRLHEPAHGPRWRARAEFHLERLGVTFLGSTGADGPIFLVLDPAAHPCDRSADPTGNAVGKPEKLFADILELLVREIGSGAAVGIGPVFAAPGEIVRSFELAAEASRSTASGVWCACSPVPDPYPGRDRNRPDSSNEQNWPLRTERSRAIVDEACRFLRAHYAEDVTLDSVAARYRLSSSHLSRLFKLHRGVNFIDYLTDVRISRAKELLREPSANIKEVSAAAGYRDPNYFSRVFKRVVGVNPTEYR